MSSIAGNSDFFASLALVVPVKMLRSDSAAAVAKRWSYSYSPIVSKVDSISREQGGTSLGIHFIRLTQLASTEELPGDHSARR